MICHAHMYCMDGCTLVMNDKGVSRRHQLQDGTTQNRMSNGGMSRSSSSSTSTRGTGVVPVCRCWLTIYLPCSLCIYIRTLYIPCPVRLTSMRRTRSVQSIRQPARPPPPCIVPYLHPSIHPPSHTVLRRWIQPVKGVDHDRSPAACPPNPPPRQPLLLRPPVWA